VGIENSIGSDEKDLAERAVALAEASNYDRVEAGGRGSGKISPRPLAGRAVKPEPEIGDLQRANDAAEPQEQLENQRDRDQYFCAVDDRCRTGRNAAARSC
jgi:hypothetical protein